MRLLRQPFRLLKGALLAAALLSAACSDNDTAIFYYLENEEPVLDYSLDNQSTIKGMAHAGGYYFASLGGSIWQRPDTGTDWVKVAKPAGADYVGPLVLFGANLYVSVSDGSTLGLYSAPAAASPAWSAVSNQGPLQSRQVTGLWSVNGRLFACVKEGSSYVLYSSDNPGTNPFVAAAVSDDTPVGQVTFGGTLNNYYVAVGTRLLQGAAATTITTDVTPPAAGGGRFEGVYAATDNNIYAATDADFVDGPDDGGRLFESDDDGTSWTVTGEVSDSGDVRFLRIGEVGGTILIGSMEHGLFRLPAGAVASYDRLPDTTDTELYAGTVLDFYVNGTITFALTAGSGLWRSDGDFSVWVRE
jgi:hypothetical protein